MSVPPVSPGITPHTGALEGKPAGSVNEKASLEKASAVHLDRTLSRANTASEKGVPQSEGVDYSGAYTKTDPKEIALVKKLDRWIMVWFTL